MISLNFHSFSKIKVCINVFIACMRNYKSRKIYNLGQALLELILFIYLCQFGELRKGSARKKELDKSWHCKIYQDTDFN